MGPTTTAPTARSLARPAYLRVLGAFLRNSLMRDMMFSANFVIEVVSSLSWMLMNLGFYVLIFEYTPMIGVDSGWGKYEFFVFLSTTLFVNSLVQAFFMSNVDEFSELVRTGGLDFALLKPIDTQFLVSLQKVDWSSLGNTLFAAGLLGYALFQLGHCPGPLQWGLYLLYVACGVAVLYSLMIALASAAVWLGRNQSLYDFWFYITNFSRYPMEIYHGPLGTPLQWLFTFVIPILVVVNVPARLMRAPLEVRRPEDWWLPLFALLATGVSLLASRRLFLRALESYRSASS